MPDLKPEVGKKYVRRDGVGGCLVLEKQECGYNDVLVRVPEHVAGVWYDKYGGYYGSSEWDLIAEDKSARVEPVPPIEIGDFPLCRALSAKEPKPEPRRWVWWFNGYPDGIFGGYRTKGHADENCATSRIACLRIEFTEGQFDEPQPGDPV